MLLSDCREKVKALCDEEKELQAKGEVELSQLLRETQLLIDSVRIAESIEPPF